MQEHKLAIRRGEQYSQVWSHMMEHNHKFDFNGVKVIASDPTKSGRLLKEAWYSDDTTINRHIDLHPAYRNMRFWDGRKHQSKKKKSPNTRHLEYSVDEPREQEVYAPCIEIPPIRGSGICLPRTEEPIRGNRPSPHVSGNSFLRTNARLGDHVENNLSVSDQTYFMGDRLGDSTIPSSAPFPAEAKPSIEGRAVLTCTLNDRETSPCDTWRAHAYGEQTLIGCHSDHLEDRTGLNFTGSSSFSSAAAHRTATAVDGRMLRTGCGDTLPPVSLYLPLPPPPSVVMRSIADKSPTCVDGDCPVGRVVKHPQRTSARTAGETLFGSCGAMGREGGEEDDNGVCTGPTGASQGEFPEKECISLTDGLDCTPHGACENGEVDMIDSNQERGVRSELLRKATCYPTPDISCAIIHRVKEPTQKPLRERLPRRCKERNHPISMECTPGLTHIPHDPGIGKEKRRRNLRAVSDTRISYTGPVTRSMHRDRRQCL